MVIELLDGLLCRASDEEVVVQTLPPVGFRSYNNISHEMLDLVYTNIYVHLESAFDFFDTDQNGIISKCVKSFSYLGMDVNNLASPLHLISLKHLV